MTSQMTGLNFKVETSDKIFSLLKEKKAKVSEALALALSNKAISENLTIPIKTVERILNELNKRFENKSKVYNPRLRLLSSLVTRDLLDYSVEGQPRLVSDLKENLRKTLVLSCIGFSNKAIARLFDLSEKAIELRFSQLFDYFNVDTKNQTQLNPRVSLFISAYCRGNIKKNQLQRLCKESSIERLEQLFDQPKHFLNSLEEEYRFIG